MTQEQTLHYFYSFKSIRASLVAQTVKNSPAMQETWDDLWVGKTPLEEGLQSTPYSCLENSYGQRSLAGYSANLLSCVLWLRMWSMWSWEEFCYCWIKESIHSNYILLVDGALNSTVFFLIFCPPNLCISDGGVLTSPSMIGELIHFSLHF